MVSTYVHRQTLAQIKLISDTFTCNSGSSGVMVNTLGSSCNDPGSIPGPGGAAWIWVYYRCGFATPSAREKQKQNL